MMMMMMTTTTTMMIIIGGQICNSTNKANCENAPCETLLEAAMDFVSHSLVEMVVLTAFNSVVFVLAIKMFLREIEDESMLSPKLNWHITLVKLRTSLFSLARHNTIFCNLFRATNTNQRHQ